MTQIGSISSATAIPQTAAPQTAIPQNASAEALPVDQVPPTGESAPEAGSTSDAADVSSSSTSTRNSKDADDADSKRTESVESLQRQIAELQKQLAQAREELGDVRGSNLGDEQKGTLAGALQVQIAMLNTSLMSLMMKLAEAIANENGKILDQTGGRLPPQT
ncbi:hypothetical protein [Bordetella sp. LUAb4]|uniref:hypothetical protein n=1 Tax=Bordetella sp. LUAb4 TaxID=2843195 RepID=UPI001E4567DB|nr:hypothetical protein [Bordetella sp. LUAb4]